MEGEYLGLEFREHVTEEGTKIPYAVVPIDLYVLGPKEVWDIVGEQSNLTKLFVRSPRNCANVFIIAQEGKDQIESIIKEHGEIIIAA